MLKPTRTSTSRSARRVVWRRLPLLFVLGWMSISIGAFQDPKPRARVLETLSTKAGTVKLLEVVDVGIGETNWYVMLKGKRIFGTNDDVFGSVGFHSIFKSGLDAEVILLQETFDIGGCTEFRVIDIRPARPSKLTDRFGNCNNDPLITQSGGTLTFSFLAKGDSGQKSEVWSYHSGALTKQ